MSRNVRIAVGVLISVAALYLAIPPRSEWAAVANAFRDVNYLYIIPLAILSAYSIFIRAQRWQLLLRPIGEVALLPLVSATSIGFLCNMILPLRVGEIVRPVLLARRSQQPLSSVLASVVLERLLDMLTILAFLGIVIATIPVSDVIRSSGLAFVVVAVIAIALILALQRRNAVAVGMVEAVIQRLPAAVRQRAEPALHDFIEGLQSVRGGEGLWKIGLYSLYLWGIIASIFGLGFVACGLPVPTVVGSLAMVAVVAGAVSAPSAPGFIGTFQAGCVLALALFGVGRADAIPYAFVIWAVQWLTQVILGVVFVLRENISFQDLQSVETE